MYPSCSPWYGSGMSMLTFRPTTSSGAYAEDALDGTVVEGSMQPRSSIVMTPSTVVWTMARARATLSARGPPQSAGRRFRRPVIAARRIRRTRRSASGAPASCSPASGTSAGARPCPTERARRPEEALHGHGEVVAPVAAERLGGARDLHARGESGGARRVDLAALGRVHEHGSRAVEGHERRGLRAEGRAGVGRRSASASTMLRRAGDTSAARRRSAASYGSGKEDMWRERGREGQGTARAPSGLLCDPRHACRGDPLRGMAGQTHILASGKERPSSNLTPRLPDGRFPDGDASARCPRTKQQAFPKLETFEYDDDIVRKFIFATIVWGVGRIAGRPVHRAPASHAGIERWPRRTSASAGCARCTPTRSSSPSSATRSSPAIYYSTQRLLKARMSSDGLSRVHFWGWQAIIVAAAITLPARHHPGQGVRRARVADRHRHRGRLGRLRRQLLLARSRAAASGTSTSRIWFYIATIVTVAVLHVVNNLAIPVGLLQELLRSTPACRTRFMQWWYGHNAVAFFLTTPFLGLMYYFLPKAADRPVFSLPALDHPLLVAGLHLHLGGPAPPALHGAARLGAHARHGVQRHAVDALAGAA